MKRLGSFIRKNYKLLICISIVLILISLFYYKFEFKKIVREVGDILAIPSFLISFVVWNSVDIRPENLNSYYELRKKQEINRKRIKEKALCTFNEKLNEIKMLNKKFKIYAKNIDLGVGHQYQLADSLDRYDELVEFYKDTCDYIYDDFMISDTNTGQLDSIEKIEIKTIDNAKEIREKLKNNLNAINKNMFNVDKFKGNTNILKELFGEGSDYMDKYIEVCSLASHYLKEGE